MFGLAIAYLIVSIQAQPNSEVSFLGIRFKKRHRSVFFELKKFIRLPRRSPEEWNLILGTFKVADTNRIEAALLTDCMKEAGVSVLETEHTCNEMIDYGLLRLRLGVYHLTPKGIKKANELEFEEVDDKE